MGTGLELTMGDRGGGNGEEGYEVEGDGEGERVEAGKVGRPRGGGKGWPEVEAAEARHWRHRYLNLPG